MSGDVSPLKDVIRRIGGIQATADLLGLSYSAVAHWRVIPLRHAVELAHAARVPLAGLLPQRAPREDAA